MSLSSFSYWFTFASYEFNRDEADVVNRMASLVKVKWYWCDCAELLVIQDRTSVFPKAFSEFWQVSRLICSSRIQRRRSFSERVGPRLIFLKSSQVSSCWKRSREVTTEPITVLTKIDSQWLHVATARRRCYYLERSKINHIAIKWTKYENVNGLVASHKIWWSPNF